MADLAALQVSLELQTASFERGMAQANASMARMEANSKKTSAGISSIANGLKGMAAGAGIAAIASMAKSLMDAADAAADTAAAFGTSIDRIYAYNQAMLESGGKSDAMANGLQKLADTVDSAFEGTDAAVEAFARLGISMDSIKNQKLDQIFERVTEALAKETDEVKRNALAKDILGKSMIGVEYEKFNDAIAQSAEKYKDLQPWLQRAADTSDALAATWKSFTTYLTAGVGVASKIASDLASAFGKIYDVVSGNKSLLQALTFSDVEKNANAAAPAIERVAKATGSQVKAAAEAAREMESLNKAIAKQVESQIQWEQSLLDSINPMNEIDRNLAKLQIAMDSGRLSADQYAEAFFKITDAGKGLEAVKTPLDEIGVAVGNTLASGVNQLVDGFFEAKKSFSDFASSFLTNIAKMIVQMVILQGIKKSLGGTAAGSWLGFANGGAFNGSTGLPQGVYSSPTFFPMPGGGLSKFANGGVPGMGVLAEAGRSEAIVPLTRHGADLGVKASPVNINVVNNTDTQVDVSSSETQDGGKTIDIMITQKIKEAFGNGTMDKSMRMNYGLSRRGS